MVSLIEDPDTINGWFLIDNNASDASQDFLLRNQTVYEQLAHIHGDLGKLVERKLSFLVLIDQIRHSNILWYSSSIPRE